MLRNILLTTCIALGNVTLAFGSDSEVLKESLSQKFFFPISYSQHPLTQSAPNTSYTAKREALPPAPSFSRIITVASASKTTNNFPPLPPEASLAIKTSHSPFYNELMAQSSWEKLNQSHSSIAKVSSCEVLDSDDEEYNSGSMVINDEVKDDRCFSIDSAAADKKIKEDAYKLISNLRTGLHSLSPRENLLLDLPGFQVEFNNALCLEGKKHRHRPRRQIYSVLMQLQTQRKTEEIKTNETIFKTRFNKIKQFWVDLTTPSKAQ